MKTIATARLAATASAAVLALALCAPSLSAAAELTLSGADEVPPVTTSATGAGTINVATDGAVNGSVKTTGIKATMAHIHMAPGKGKNGPVIIPLTQSAPDVWSVPAGAKLSPEQLKAYEAGDLYVNVHSAEHKAGEIRAPLMP